MLIDSDCGRPGPRRGEGHVASRRVLLPDELLGPLAVVAVLARGPVDRLEKLRPLPLLPDPDRVSEKITPEEDVFLQDETCLLVGEESRLLLLEDNDCLISAASPLRKTHSHSLSKRSFGKRSL